jgi:S1-C subfamily serine protease
MKRLNIIFVSILLTVLLVFAGCASNNANTPKASSTQNTPTVTASTSSPAFSASGIETTLEEIYSMVNPSVVNIDVLIKQQTRYPQINGFSFSTPQQQVEEGLGSGFVWDTDGDIVTNNHVVADATNITVTFYDGTEVPAKLVGADADSDLAVVKVKLPDDSQIKPVQLGDSSQLKVGQQVIAIGNPFGLQNTMTTGIVSALGRVIPTNQNTTGLSYDIPDIIQTDAAINPGNSGGVLLDDTGKMIGVPSDIATTSGTSAGIAFAIPSNIVQQVIPALIKTGHYDHPYLGLILVSLIPDIATAMNLPSDQRGALVETVNANGPGDKAGIQGSSKQLTINGQQLEVGGDVIIAYNGQVVKSSDDVVTYLAGSSVGQTVTLTVLRGGKQIQVKVTLGTRPST